ncbi:MAG: spermine synthase [Verrucomicrobiales bacterium]|jgi:spermidine synthase|nr:spermine synthase [Verrucomicrobiales bacterium]
MKPFRTLAETRTPDGSRFSLHEHDGDFSLKYNGTQLMTSSWTESELLLADEACRFKPARKAPTVVIGGMGLGFSLQRVLELVDAEATVWVAELLPEVIEWNQKYLSEVNGALLEEPRVKTYVGDVYRCIADAGPGAFDAILLDVDNGPSFTIQPGNKRLYDRHGLGMIHDSLKPGGRVTFWAADPERGFPGKLRKAGFFADEISAKAHKGAKRAIHRIYIGEKRG